MLFIVSILIFLSCQNPSFAELRPEDVEEGSCIIPYPKAAAPSFNFAMNFLKNANTPFYVPMGSQHLYRAYASYLLGRAPASQTELNQMNLRIRGSILHNWRTTGYGQSFFQQCRISGRSTRAYCKACLGSPQTNLKTIRTSVDTLVYTDEKSVGLITRCVMGKWNDWKVVSTKPRIPEDTKNKILSMITELGFNSSMAAYLNYTQ